MSAMPSTGALQAKRNRELNGPFSNERDESSSSGNRVGGSRFVSPQRIESKYTEPERTSSSSFKPPKTRDAMKRSKVPDSPEHHQSSLSSALSFFKNVFTGRASQPPTNTSSEIGSVAKPLTIKVVEKVESAKKDNPVVEKIEITAQSSDLDLKSKTETSEEIENESQTPNPLVNEKETTETTPPAAKDTKETNVEKKPRRKPKIPFSFDPKKIRPSSNSLETKTPGRMEKSPKYLPPTILPSLPSDCPIDSQWEARMKKIEQFKRRHLILPPTVIEPDKSQLTAQSNMLDPQQGFVFPPREIKPVTTSASPVRSHKVEPTNNRWKWNQDDNRDNKKSFGKRSSQPKQSSKTTYHSPKRSSQKKFTPRESGIPPDDYTRTIVQKSESVGSTTYRAIASPSDYTLIAKQRSPLVSMSSERTSIKHRSPNQRHDFWPRKNSPLFRDDKSKKSRFRSKSTSDKLSFTSVSEHTPTDWKTRKRAKSVVQPPKTQSQNSLVDDRDVPMIYPKLKTKVSTYMQRTQKPGQSKSTRRVSSNTSQSSRKSKSNDRQSLYSARRSTSRENFGSYSPVQSDSSSFRQPAFYMFQSPRSSSATQGRNRSRSSERQPLLGHQSPPVDGKFGSPKSSSPSAARRSFSGHQQLPSPASARRSPSPRSSPSSARNSFSHRPKSRAFGQSSSLVPLSPASARRSMSSHQSPSSYKRTPSHHEARKPSPWRSQMSRDQSHSTKASSKATYPYRQANSAKDRSGTSKRGSPSRAHKTQSQGDFQSKVKVADGFGVRNEFEDGRSKQTFAKSITSYKVQHPNRPQMSFSYNHHPNRSQGMSTWAVKNQHPVKQQPSSNSASKNHRLSKQQSVSGRGSKSQHYNQPPRQSSPLRQYSGRQLLQSPTVSRQGQYQPRLQSWEGSEAPLQEQLSPLRSSMEPPKSPSLLRSAEMTSPPLPPVQLDDEPKQMPPQRSPSATKSDKAVHRSSPKIMASPVPDNSDRNPVDSQLERLEVMSVSPLPVEKLDYLSPSVKLQSPEISYAKGNYSEMRNGNEDFVCDPNNYASDHFQVDRNEGSYISSNLSLHDDILPPRAMTATSGARVPGVLISPMIQASRSETNANFPEQDRSNSASSYLAYYKAPASVEGYNIHMNAPLIDNFKDDMSEEINCSNSSLYNPPTQKDAKSQLYRGMLQDSIFLESADLANEGPHRDLLESSIADIKELHSQNPKNVQKGLKDGEDSLSKNKNAHPGPSKKRSTTVTLPVTTTRVQGNLLSSPQKESLENKDSANFPQKESLQENDIIKFRLKDSKVDLTSSISSSTPITKQTFMKAMQDKGSVCEDCAPVKGNDSDVVQRAPQKQIPLTLKKLRETTPQVNSGNKRRIKKDIERLQKATQLRSPATEFSPLQFRQGAGKVPVQKSSTWGRNAAASTSVTSIGSIAKRKTEQESMGMAIGQKNSSPQAEFPVADDAERQTSPASVMKKTITFFSSFFTSKEKEQVEPEDENDEKAFPKEDEISARMVYYDKGVPQSTFHKSLTSDRSKSQWPAPKEEFAPKDGDVLASSAAKNDNKSNVYDISPEIGGPFSSRRPGDYGSVATMMGEIP